MRDFDPRDRDDDDRAIEMPWVDLRHEPGLEREQDEAREGGDVRDRDRDTRERDHDPRDQFLEGLELPRGLEREIVMDGDHRYELNGDDSRTLAAVGAFRVVAERDLRDPRGESADTREPDLRHLRDEGLARSVELAGRERAVTLTKGGHHLLEAHRRDQEDTREQAFYAGETRAQTSTLSSLATSSSASIRSGCRSTIAAGRTAMDAPIATRTRSKNGRGTTTFRTSMRRCIFLIRIEYELQAHQPALARPASRVRIAAGRARRPARPGAGPSGPRVHHHDRALRQSEARESPGRGYAT
jgi:hypothetical protein